jgi:hypothetical protein
LRKHKIGLHHNTITRVYFKTGNICWNVVVREAT